MKFYLINNGNYIFFRSIHGGTPIIGKGMSGTVLKPDIKHHNDKYISKLFILPKEITIDQFIELENNLNRNDPSNKFHLPMIDIDIINESYDLSELNKEDREKYTYIATYEYGGLSLNLLISNPDYNSKITPFFCREIFNGFLHLYDGIIHFAEYNINHCDIHMGNIVLDLDNPSFMRFIDFNLVSPFYDFNMNYIQDIISLLSTIEEVMGKFLIIFQERKNHELVDYFKTIILILEQSYRTLFHDDDINNIIIIKQTLKDKFSEINSIIEDM
jgi:hypothetical protein